MAYAALVSLAQTLDHLLAHHKNNFIQRLHEKIVRYLSFLDKFPRQAHHEKRHIQSLRDQIVSLLNFLDEFPRQATKLETRITIATNRVEDIFELHMLDQNGSNVGHNLEELYKEIDSIVKEAMEIKTSCTSENQMLSIHSSASLSSPLVEGGVVGFEQDLLEIKLRIYGESPKLEVIPIVGMGGIGKTTLARYALHDPLTAHHFDVSALVSVSQNYEKADILSCLLNSIDPSSKGMEFKDELEIHERVYKYLIGRRFLVVVDDVWNENDWDNIRMVFPDDLNRSRIIITTRDLDVASRAETCTHPHEMHLMSVDLGWSLLRQKVFQDEQCPPQLEEIGRDIAKKCGGLPLAIVVIAGVLSKLDLLQDSWKKIAMSVNEAVNTSDEPFMGILSLSYTYLPHHLRPCFLYMGAFPEDEEIHASKLIRLWVAEGFLKPKVSKDLEGVAEDYLEELAKRSLVLINKKRYNGKIKSIKMHDLLRDVCLRKAADEKFLRVIHDCSGSFPEGVEHSRRLSILSNSWAHFEDMDNLPIHTLLVSRYLSSDFWKFLRLLRVADLMSSKFRWDGEEIGTLHLRYLAICRAADLKRLAVVVCGSLSKLQNLQTLIIGGSNFSGSIYLPFEIWRMRELRQIIALDCYLPEPSTDQILPLEKLHTLKQITCFRWSKRILELIPNLKKLGLSYSSYHINKTKNWSEYGLNNLVHLQKLENLNIYADPHDYSESDFSHRLALPTTLKKLTLCGTEIPWEDMSIVGLLPNLQVLKLKQRSCRGLMWETFEEQFCELKVLLIDSTDPSDWITESSHFPRLEQLILRGCYNLREIPNDIGDIPTLQLIEVDRCNSSVVDSAKYIEEEQRDNGNQLQLHLNIPHVSEMDAL